MLPKALRVSRLCCHFLVVMAPRILEHALEEREAVQVKLGHAKQQFPGGVSLAEELFFLLQRFSFQEKRKEATLLLQLDNIIDTDRICLPSFPSSRGYHLNVWMIDY